MKVEERSMEGEEHTERVRRICMSLPGCEEKLSHGEPTWFVRKRVFVMFANNHHNDGHVAVWLPVPPGMQESLIQTSPKRFYRPPYVGTRGWVGIELSRVGDEELSMYILEAWKQMKMKKAAK